MPWASHQAAQLRLLLQGLERPWLGKLTNIPQSLNADLHWWSCPLPASLVLVLRDSDTGRVNEQGRAGVAEGSEGKADWGGGV